MPFARRRRLQPARRAECDQIGRSACARAPDIEGKMHDDGTENRCERASMNLAEYGCTQRMRCRPPLRRHLSGHPRSSRSRFPAACCIRLRSDRSNAPSCPAEAGRDRSASAKIWRAVKRRMIGSYILRYCVLNWRLHRTPWPLVCIPAAVGLNLCSTAHTRSATPRKLESWWWRSQCG